jgi:hypothetical protein
MMPPSLLHTQAAELPEQQGEEADRGNIGRGFGGGGEGAYAFVPGRAAKASVGEAEEGGVVYCAPQVAAQHE